MQPSIPTRRSIICSSREKKVEVLPASTAFPATSAGKWFAILRIGCRPSVIKGRPVNDMTTAITRRRLLALGGACAAGAANILAADPPADITLRIGEITADIGWGRSIRTLAYNGRIPGPVLRMTEGKTVVIDVINETRLPEMIH